jgi:MraZ protein
MFYGRFGHSIDDKGRLILPSKVRIDLGLGVYATRGIDHCLYLYPRAEWERLSDKMRQLPLTNKDARQFRRFFYGEASELEVDKQGRILIPAYLREYAGLKTEVVLIGAEDHLEVWNAEAYKQENTALEQDPEALAQKLSVLGIL